MCEKRKKKKLQTTFFISQNIFEFIYKMCCTIRKRKANVKYYKFCTLYRDFLTADLDNKGRIKKKYIHIKEESRACGFLH